MLHSVYGHIIEIWEPRYKDKKVLIGRHHVMDGTNYITFTRAEHLKDKVFQVNGAIIRNCHLQANGRGEVYCVPMNQLKLIGYLTDKQMPTVTLTNSMIASHLEAQGFRIFSVDSDDMEYYVQGKKDNLMVTIQPGVIYFDKIVPNRQNRSFETEPIDFHMSWSTLEDINLKELPAEITQGQTRTVTIGENPLAI